MGQYEEQLKYLQRALAIREKAYSADHPYLAITKTNLGDAYIHLKRYSEAQKNLEEALETFSKPGSEVARKVKALRLYGELHHKMKKEQKAMQMLKEALALQEEKGMREHPGTALVLRSLGEVEQTLGQKEEAQKHLREALSIQLQKLPQGHPETEKTKKIIECLTI